MIDQKTTEHIAELARIKLTEKEKEEFTKELNEILKAFEVLDTAEKAEPAYHPIDIRNRMREDKETGECKYKELLESSTQKENTHIKGPRII